MAVSQNKNKHSERIKIQDVARLAQVSLSTVSGVLNEKENVRPETRQRVLEVIAQLATRPTCSPATWRGDRRRSSASSSQIC